MIHVRVMIFLRYGLDVLVMGKHRTLARVK
jgi:hypothetical protein